MPLGDGQQWDESNPTQNTSANTLDSYGRDARIGTRLRMQNEHWWPSSQTSATEAGYHRFISFQPQTATPSFPIYTVTATTGQCGAIWMDTSQNLYFVNVVSGTTSTPILIASPTSIAYPPYIKCTNTQSSGTGGGSGSSNAWTIVPLNTKNTDTASIASLVSNQVTIPAGTYRVRASCPMFTTSGNGSPFKIRLYNVTASSTIIEGQSNTAYNTGTGGGDGSTHGNNSILEDIFTIASSSAIELQYFASNSFGSAGTNALGYPVTSGDNEIYATLILEKIA